MGEDYSSPPLASMRYIGNKTRLLPFILRVLRRLGEPPGVAHDAFAGTAAVGRALKGEAWRVVSSDLMTYSYVFQRAYVVAAGPPGFRALCADDPELARALRSPALRARIDERVNGNGHPSSSAERRLAAVGEYLAGWLDPEPGFVTAHFSPAGGRMFFSEGNAARIDAARAALERWRTAELISADAYFILLAALIEGADRVANTAGVYAAYIKSWQSNARRPLLIVPEMPLRGGGSSAHQGDAAEVARDAGPVDLLYIDPPYNARQYAGYYHVPELIARGWFGDPPGLRGKTGLLDGTPRSRWCSSKHVAGALEHLLEATSARHVLVSYNSEGLLPDDDLRGLLADAAIDGRVRRFTHHYRRYRSDSDRVGRQYKGDHVHELLYYARLR
ncbi:MAG TPA: DNA adenine methylase [Gemmatimonadaceae bacterium]|nr:DNA adenine methylase [Gemmatimonadaceae bacterium]